MLSKNVSELALIRPIDNDPIYKNIKLLNEAGIQSVRPGTRSINFRVNARPLQEDPTLMLCKNCGSFLTQKGSDPDCRNFVDEYTMECDYVL